MGQQKGKRNVTRLGELNFQTTKVGDCPRLDCITHCQLFYHRNNPSLEFRGNNFRSRGLLRSDGELRFELFDVLLVLSKVDGLYVDASAFDNECPVIE
jgi:hypothetical protein